MARVPVHPLTPAPPAGVTRQDSAAGHARQAALAVRLAADLYTTHLHGPAAGLATSAPARQAALADTATLLHHSAVALRLLTSNKPATSCGLTHPDLAWLHTHLPRLARATAALRPSPNMPATNSSGLSELSTIPHAPDGPAGQLLADTAHLRALTYAAARGGQAGHVPLLADLLADTHHQSATAYRQLLARRQRHHVWAGPCDELVNAEQAHMRAEAEWRQVAIAWRVAVRPLDPAPLTLAHHITAIHDALRQLLRGADGQPLTADQLYPHRPATTILTATLTQLTAELADIAGHARLTMRHAAAHGGLASARGTTPTGWHVCTPDDAAYRGLLTAHIGGEHASITAAALGHLVAARAGVRPVPGLLHTLTTRAPHGPAAEARATAGDTLHSRPAARDVIHTLAASRADLPVAVIAARSGRHPATVTAVLKLMHNAGIVQRWTSPTAPAPTVFYRLRPTPPNQPHPDPPGRTGPASRTRPRSAQQPRRDPAGYPQQRRTGGRQPPKLTR